MEGGVRIHVADRLPGTADSVGARTWDVPTACNRSIAFTPSNSPTAVLPPPTSRVPPPPGRAAAYGGNRADLAPAVPPQCTI